MAPQPAVREPELELIADYPCETGEGPLWHPEHECLYWLDIPPGRIYQYTPATSSHHLVYQADRPIGGFTIQTNGDLLLFMGAGKIMKWHEGATETVVEEIAAVRASRFNDVMAGPQGQVYCGTMAASRELPPDGRLYRLDPDGSLEEKLDGLGTSNGMGYSPDRQYFYHTDTRPGVIHRYRWDDEQGDFDPAHGEKLYEARAEPDYGRPDGMTVDAAGHLWIAHWDGFSLVHTNAHGEVLEFLALPVRKVSSVTFGGPDLTDMYVTTAGGNDRSFNGTRAGALYRIRGEGQGLPEFRSRILLH